MSDPCTPVVHSSATLRAWAVWHAAHPWWKPLAVAVGCAAGLPFIFVPGGGSLPLAPVPPAPPAWHEGAGPPLALYWQPAAGEFSSFAPRSDQIVPGSGPYEVPLPNVLNGEISPPPTVMDVPEPNVILPFALAVLLATLGRKH
jgi:hypothetical protein